MTEQHITPLYLDDVTVGDTFLSGEHLVTEEEITRFAKDYDPQPYHLDPEAAKDTFFHGLVASGWQTAGMSMRLIVESVPVAGGIVGAAAEISWLRPTRPGETLHVRTTVHEIKPSTSRPDRGKVTLECITMNQDDEVCQRMYPTLVMLRRPTNP